MVKKFVIVASIVLALCWMEDEVILLVIYVVCYFEKRQLYHLAIVCSLD